MREEVDASLTERLLEPVAGEAGPCGPKLEYDPRFQALEAAAKGKPETQFDPGMPPNWGDVLQQAEALLSDTKDLRIAVYWARAMVNRRGFAALATALHLLHALLQRYWADVHPMADPDPEVGDYFERMNALLSLEDAQDGLLADVRQSKLMQGGPLGDLTLRAAELALTSGAKNDDGGLTKDQLALALADATRRSSAFAAQARSAMAELHDLKALLQNQVGHAFAPEFISLSTLLKGICSLLPPNAAQPQASSDVSIHGQGVTSSASAIGAHGGGTLSGAVNSRADAIRAIEMVCFYLERAEPTNPAPLFLRRAQRLIGHNFLQLIKELAPESLNEVARVVGVDPDDVSLARAESES